MPPVVFWCTIKTAMKINRHIVIHCLLALCLFILPLQSAWAMTSMASFGMDMEPHQMSDMDMSDHHEMMKTSSVADMGVSSMDCDENHCDKCLHVASFILTSFVFTDNPQHQQFTAPSMEHFSSFLVTLDSPPPIFS